MKFIVVDNYEALSEQVALIMVEEVKINKNANLCLASGSSPEKSYDIFVQKLLDEKINVENVLFTKLDEWCGFYDNYEVTCEKYLRDKLITPLRIADSKYISFKPDALDYDREVENVRLNLQETPVTLSILGLGKNGHLGLNEPASFLSPFAHISLLADITKMHDMVKDVEVISGMTIGMNEINNSKKIILIVSGLGKQEIFDRFLTGQICSTLPASFLWLHQDVTVIVQGDHFRF